jgi:hypothetical protein
LLNWLKRSLWEVDRSTSLSVLGGLIALGHAVTHFYWVRVSILFAEPPSAPLLCWSFQSSCEVPFFSGTTLKGLFWLQLFLSILAGVLFFLRRGTGIAWWGLLLSWSLHAWTYSQDASLRGNTYAFFLLLGFGFLFLPNKTALTRYLFLFYYLADAITKINADWLSGIAFVGHFEAPMKGFEWLAAFSIVFQMVMPFFLISRDGQRMGYGFGVLFAYELLYSYIMRDAGYLVVGLILVFFIFHHFERKRLELEAMYQSYEHPEPTNVWWPAFLAIFVWAQIPTLAAYVPQLELVRMDRVKSTEECQVLAFVRSAGFIQWLKPDHSANLPERWRCHAQANFNVLKHQCVVNRNQPGFQDLSVYYLTRGIAEVSYRLLYGTDEFCSSSFAETLTSTSDSSQNGGKN